MFCRKRQAGADAKRTRAARGELLVSMIRHAAPGL
jgi:hypothetical protein